MPIDKIIPSVLNKSDDERLIKKNEMTDALNITVSTSGDGSGFVVKNADGRRESAAFYPAGSATDYYALIITDPDQEYEIQEDSDGGFLAVEDRGENINLIGIGTGNENTGLSYGELDSSSVATTNTHQLRIIRPAQGVENEVAANYCKWIVKINNSTETAGTGI